MRVERLAREYDIAVETVHFPLHPETPAEGIALESLFGGPEARPRIAASQRRLRELARAEGLPMVERDMTYNSRSAQELGAWAAEKGRGAEFDRAVFRAYFAEAKNISDRGVLLDAAEAAGLGRAEAARVLDERSFRAVVDAHGEASRRAGVTAVPTFVAGGESVVGAQPYERLETLVVAAGAKRREK